MTVRTLLASLSDMVDFISRIILVLAVTTFVLVIFIAVLGRYVFHVSIYASSEIARIAFIWSCFLGASVATKRKAHILLTFLVERMSERTRKVIGNIMVILSILFCIAVGTIGIGLANASFDSYLPIMGISEFWLFLAFPVSFYFMSLHLVAQLFSRESN